MNVKVIKLILFVFIVIFLVVCGSKISDKSVIEMIILLLISSEMDLNYIDVVMLVGDVIVFDINNLGYGFFIFMFNLSDLEFDIYLIGDVNFEIFFMIVLNDVYLEFDGLGFVFNNNNCNVCY